MATSRPHGVSIGQAARAAASDFYFNTLRFVPANVAWALAVAAELFVAATWAPAIVLTPAIAIPFVGITRMAALLTRSEPASLSDFVDGMRRFGLAATGIAAALAIVAAILVTNVATGFSANDPIGWFLGASALWGLIALAMAAVAVWPTLVDPAHENEHLRQRLKLAGLVMVGRPGWLFVVTLLTAVVLIASTVLLGAIVLVGVAYASLFATRWVLPAVDELQARYEAARASR